MCFCVIPFNCVFAFTLLILLHNFKTSFEDVVASRPRPSWARAHRDVRGRSTCSRQPLRLQKLSHDGQLSSSSSTAVAARRCIYYYQFAFSFFDFYCLVYCGWFWLITVIIILIISRLSASRYLMIFALETASPSRSRRPTSADWGQRLPALMSFSAFWLWSYRTSFSMSSSA